MTLTDDYSYELPDDLIAQQPAANRHDARLLLLDRTEQSISHHHIRDLPELLRSGDGLVVNDTRVIPAKLVGYRTKTGGRWQGLFIEADQDGRWLVMGNTRGKPAAGETITLQDSSQNDLLKITLLAKQEGGQWIVQPEKAGEPLELLQEVGQVPLPHYIRGGQMAPKDVERYQTVFAEHPGAVAAPTAGLHFTPALLDRIEAKGITKTSVTLHVGVGTFRPVTVDRLDDHKMHSEWGDISESAVSEIAQIGTRGGRLIAVGTTVVRTLESAIQTKTTLSPWQGQTDLFIRPPFEFKCVNGLLTNFHLPRSTLLVLVRTFGGDKLVRAAYQEAIRERYRFYSYGDAMLIL